jgi:hypothetical protein
MVSMLGFFSKNEWRAPLLELSAELEKNQAIKDSQSGAKKRGFSVVIFFMTLFIIGGVILLRSPIFQNYKNVLLIVLAVLLLWLLKGSYELFRAFYSKKTRLLNYLFSPYLFAWRRDHLSQYSDQEIAAAICRVCKIHDDSLIQGIRDLKDFLIALHRKTRPIREHESYPDILNENISQAERMIHI